MIRAISAPTVLLLPVLAVCFLPGPVLLGLWESLTYYHTFGAVDAPLSFLIAPRANIGGQGYAALEFIRPLIAWTGLPLSLYTYRMPALAYSVISLIIFYVIARRAFGAWPALGATALLAANPIFFQAGHMMSVLVVSGTALLLLIERLQALETRYWKPAAWFGTGVAAALVALHYGPGRIFGVALVGAWFLRALWLWRDIPGAARVRRTILLFGLASGSVSLLVLGFLDARNLFSVAQFPTFLLPRDSDVAVLQHLPGDGGVATLRVTLETNIRIVIESLLGLTGNYHSNNSSYIFADFRYPLLAIPVAFLAALGFFVTCARWKRCVPLLATPWASILVLLAISLFPILFSVVSARPEGVISSLSIYRLYFLLIPLHLLTAAALHYFGECRKWAVQGTFVAIGILFGFLVQSLIAERDDFSARVYAAGWERSGAGTAERWLDGAPNLDRSSHEFTTHLQQHAQYANIARKLSRRLQVEAPARRIVYVDPSYFNEALLMPSGLHYIKGRNYHSVFIALYAQDAGVRIDAVTLVNKSRTPVRPELMAGLAYRGQPREYSALLELGPDGKLRYTPGFELDTVVLQTASQPAKDLLVTTPEEEAGARAWLDRLGVDYELVKL